MSRIRTLAFAMQARLESIPELSGKIIVWSLSTENEFRKRMAKVGGRCVVIRPGPFKNESKSKHSFYSGVFTVTLIVAPVLTAKSANDSDALIAEIEGKLHGWWPDSMPSNGAVWLISDGITPDEISTNEGKSYSINVLTLRSPKMSLQS